MAKDISGETPYLVAFSTVPGIGPVRLKLLTGYFGSAAAAWKASDDELFKVGLPKDVLPQLLSQRRILNVDSYLLDIINRGIKFVTIGDKNYPERLKNIPDPPNVLFVKTDLTMEQFAGRLKSKVVAVVGTRKVTGYGREVTESLVSGLVENGFTVVSGMALGVDGIAHGVTLNGGGFTVAVLGTGVEVIYPREHRELYNSILARGSAVVSEVAPEKFVNRGIFPARNRIISGLAEAVLVTEGAIDSGSLITARAALEQGREVFAVPGPVNSFLAEGTNYLIKNGAKLVSSVQDILEELGYEPREVGQKESRTVVTGDNAEEQKIIDLLAAEAMDFDRLVLETGWSSGRLAAQLATLEIKGKLKSSGLLYQLP